MMHFITRIITVIHSKMSLTLSKFYLVLGLKYICTIFLNLYINLYFDLNLDIWRCHLNELIFAVTFHVYLFIFLYIKNFARCDIVIHVTPLTLPNMCILIEKIVIFSLSIMTFLLSLHRIKFKILAVTTSQGWFFKTQ